MYAIGEYAAQRNHSEYAAFLASNIPITGTWDDHDYGVNNAGREFTDKEVRLFAKKFYYYLEDHNIASSGMERMNCPYQRTILQDREIVSTCSRLPLCRQYP